MADQPPPPPPLEAQQTTASNQELPTAASLKFDLATRRQIEGAGSSSSAKSEKGGYLAAAGFGDKKTLILGDAFARPSASPAGTPNMSMGSYESYAQKAKLILPTAMWVLIVVAGLCFLSLLASLNRTVSTLDTLIEIEQARSQREGAAGDSLALAESPASRRGRHHDHQPLTHMESRLEPEALVLRDSELALGKPTGSEPGATKRRPSWGRGPVRDAASSEAVQQQQQPHHNHHHETFADSFPLELASGQVDEYLAPLQPFDGVTRTLLRGFFGSMEPGPEAADQRRTPDDQDSSSSLPFNSLFKSLMEAAAESDDKDAAPLLDKSTSVLANIHRLNININNNNGGAKTTTSSSSDESETNENDNDNDNGKKSSDQPDAFAVNGLEREREPTRFESLDRLGKLLMEDAGVPALGELHGIAQPFVGQDEQPASLARPQTLEDLFSAPHLSAGAASKRPPTRHTVELFIPIAAPHRESQQSPPSGSLLLQADNSPLSPISALLQALSEQTLSPGQSARKEPYELGASPIEMLFGGPINRPAALGDADEPGPLSGSDSAPAKVSPLKSIFEPLDRLSSTSSSSSGPASPPEDKDISIVVINGEPADALLADAKMPPPKEPPAVEPPLEEPKAPGNRHNQFGDLFNLFFGAPPDSKLVVAPPAELESARPALSGPPPPPPPPPVPSHALNLLPIAPLPAPSEGSKVGSVVAPSTTKTPEALKALAASESSVEKASSPVQDDPSAARKPSAVAAETAATTTTTRPLSKTKEPLAGDSTRKPANNRFLDMFDHIMGSVFSSPQFNSDSRPVRVEGGADANKDFIKNVGPEYIIESIVDEDDSGNDDDKSSDGAEQGEGLTDQDFIDDKLDHLHQDSPVFEILSFAPISS